MARIVEAIDIQEDRPFGLASGFPAISPDQLCFDGFKERVKDGITIAIAFAAHRDFETILGQAKLILVGVVLGLAIQMKDAALRRLSQRHRHIQRPDRQFPIHAIANCQTVTRKDLFANHAGR